MGRHRGRPGAVNHGELLGLVAARARSFGLRVSHNPDSRKEMYDPGFPDLVIAGGGLVLLAEIKGRDGVLSADQRAWGDALADREDGPGMTHQYVVIWPADWDSGLVEDILRTMAARAAVS